MLLNCGAREDSWTARRSNQSILKETNPEYSLEELMLELKLQSFGHLMRRANSLEKTLMLGKIEGRRRRGRQKMRWLGMTSLTQWTWVWANSRRQWRIGSLVVCGPWTPGLDMSERMNNKSHVPDVLMRRRKLDTETETNRKKAMWWWRQRLESNNTKDCWQPPESRRETWNTFPSEPSKRS